MEMISEILARYNTDKVSPHTYGQSYDALFSQFDREEPLNILEIGIQKGGSLCAWRDYFPNATVTGIDIVDEVLPEYRRDSISYIICDINDYKTTTNFDIVIDDGSHWLKDVVHSVALFSKLLNVNGIMIIEDVQKDDVWIPAILNVLSPQLDYNNGFKWVVSHYNGSVAGLEDNFLYIIKRVS